jgi:hypothetical protein
MPAMISPISFSKSASPAGIELAEVMVLEPQQRGEHATGVAEAAP